LTLIERQIQIRIRGLTEVLNHNRFSAKHKDHLGRKHPRSTGYPYRIGNNWATYNVVFDLAFVAEKVFDFDFAFGMDYMLHQ
jgi:hypothetical protein